jgi:SAM-dependent methyltransferase
MNFKGVAPKVCGVDPDERVLSNPCLVEGKIAFSEEVVYPDGSFDLIFADNVLEDLPLPAAMFIEVNRLLSQGGCFLAKPPNKLHYMPFTARLTSHRIHRRGNRWRGRNGEDVFFARYKANAAGGILELAESAGRSARQIEHLYATPKILRMCFATYSLGYLYERFVNGLGFLTRFRIFSMTELQKPSL